MKEPKGFRIPDNTAFPAQHERQRECVSAHVTKDAFCALQAECHDLVSTSTLRRQFFVVSSQKTGVPLAS